MIVLLSDDLGWNSLEHYESDRYKTPNINWLAEQGMTYTNAYAASAVDSPTRDTIMTGLSPARLRLTICRRGT